MKQYEEHLEAQLAKDGCYADVAEGLYQSFKKRLANEYPTSVLTAQQQVRLALTLELARGQTDRAVSWEQIERAVDLWAAVVFKDPATPAV